MVANTTWLIRCVAPECDWGWVLMEAASAEEAVEQAKRGRFLSSPECSKKLNNPHTLQITKRTDPEATPPYGTSVR